MNVTIPILALALCAPLVARAQQPVPTHPDTTRDSVARVPVDSSARRDSARDSARNATRALAPVVVTGTRLSALHDPRLPARVDVVQTRTAAPGPAGTGELLARVPGVSVSNDQGTSAQPTLELRGFTLSPVVGVPAGVSVFLDGVRMNEPDAQEVNLDLIPVDAADHAEVVRGPSAIFGRNSLAGAIDFITARGSSTPAANVALSAGSFGERGARLTTSGVANGIDGYLMVNASDESGWRAMSAARTRQIFATLGRRAATGDVAMSILAASDHIQEAGSLPESWLPAGRRANYTSGDFFRPRLVQLSVRGSHRLTWGELHANVFGRRNAFEQYNVNVSDANTDANVVNTSAGGTAELDVPLTLGSRPLTLTVGGEYAHGDVRYHLYARANDAAPVPAECDAGTGLCENAQSGGDDAGLFAQALLEATERLSLQLAVRGDLTRVPFRDLLDPANDGTSTFTRLSPRVGVTYRPVQGVRAYASIGSAFRAPAALELACASPDAPCPLPFSLGADPPLRPVVAWSGETGVELESTSGASLSLSVYDTDVRDEIAFVTSSSAAGYFTNVARTRRDGVESAFTLPVGGGLRTFGSYTLLDATYRSTAQLASALDGNVVQPGDRFPLMPRHRGSAGIGLTHVMGTTVFDATVTARAVSSAFFRGDEANRMPPLPGSVTGDLRASLALPHVTTTVSASNLLDRRYAIYGVYGENPKGAFGAPAPATPSVERFVTPADPRRLSVEIELHR